MLTFKIKMVISPTQSNNPKTLIPLKLTKRILLSKMAGIFDQIGAATEVLIKLHVKVAMQELGNWDWIGMKKCQRKQDKNGSSCSKKYQNSIISSSIDVSHLLKRLELLS